MNVTSNLPHDVWVFRRALGRSGCALFVSGIVVMTVFGTSAAAQQASLHVTPSVVSAGGSVTVRGTCEPNAPGVVFSNAFFEDPTHDFAGEGAATFMSDASGNFSAVAQIPSSKAPGTYSIGARCGGGNLGISLSLRVTSGGLANTGRSITAFAALGMALVVMGTLTVVVARTRRQMTTAN